MRDKLEVAQIQSDSHLACMGSRSGENLDFLLVARIRIPEGKGTLMGTPNRPW